MRKTDRRQLYIFRAAPGRHDNVRHGGQNIQFVLFCREVRCPRRPPICTLSTKLSKTAVLTDDGRCIQFAHETVDVDCSTRKLCRTTALTTTLLIYSSPKKLSTSTVRHANCLGRPPCQRHCSYTVPQRNCRSTVRHANCLGRRPSLGPRSLEATRGEL